MASTTAHDATHSADAAGQGAADHHGAADYHSDHAEEPLGPIDRAAWGMALAGGLMGLMVAGALYLSTTA